MLTVLIPCKNESHNIAACVQSARLLGGEILVADSGSIDGTLEIVAGMPDCRLIQRAFINYADFKNWAIPQASEPWVFVLDADERITEPLADEMRHVLAANPQDVDAYWVDRRTFFLGHEARFGPWWRDGVYRLFRRDVCRYAPCRVHESLQVAPGRRGRLRHQLLHYSINSYDEYFAKHVNYTRWSAADLWDRGQRSSMWRMLARPTFRFLWLYLARGGFLDGAIGLQLCMLQSFFVTLVKQGRLWEMEHARIVEDDNQATILPFSAQERRAA
jgi:glycosyltransferase involved in cell wall biosynthesis